MLKGGCGARSDTRIPTLTWVLMYVQGATKRKSDVDVGIDVCARSDKKE
jgi:hypothetical protein